MQLKNELNKSMGADGLFHRNPTHLQTIDRAREQSDVVRAIHKMKRDYKHETIVYDDPTKTTVPFPGMKRFMDLSEGEILGMFEQIMRSRPNIIDIRICLGEYPSEVIQENRSQKVIMGSSNTKLFPKEIAKRLADVFSDKSLNIVDLVYAVNNHEESSFSSTMTGFSVPQEYYENMEFFNPVVEITYLSNM